MKTTEIRQRFLDYFARHGHEVVPSSSLVPGNDPTLLFTNAGMVQFKDVFLGDEHRDSNRAVTSQRCVRAGGKHNDLENVGYTARHHTFFEMLGNFSFGDYFKAEAIRHAWTLLTEEFGLPAERLWVTVFEEDDEAERIWLEEIGVPADRVARIGAKDNFWAMGDTGPCGPCSEIFYDHGPDVAGGPPGTPEEDGDRYIEIWNLVFMQYNRDANGNLEPLPKPSVDTGMGLERIAAVMQGVHSNYEIDLFENLIREAARVLEVDDLDSKSLRVVADHIRSTAFLIVDGVTPSNEGRGYVLRRIIRRAIRHGYQLGHRQPFMHRLVAPLVSEMGDAYPELARAAGQVEQVLRRENEKFNETLDQGLKILDQEIAGLEGSVIPGEAVFRLYDTFGFPADLTGDVAREHGLTIDEAGFAAAMDQQRERARAASQFSGTSQVRIDGVEPTKFLGYDALETPVEAVALVRDEAPVEALEVGEEGVVVLASSPFYAESGGQVGDRGEIEFANGTFTVNDTRYLANKVTGHVGVVSKGAIHPGDTGQARVNPDLRSQCAHNHSATHLLHAALKAVLGAHVQQKGSLVEPARLRFDFSHFEPVSKTDLATIERLVNREIRANAAVSTVEMELDEAREEGAEALFGEKYDSRVRTVRMGEFSFELCGGTHVSRTGDIGYFRVLSETGIAAGVRRIEAVTGEGAERAVEQKVDLLEDIAGVLKATPDNLKQKLESLISSSREQQKQIQSLQAKLATAGSGAADLVKEINGVKAVAIRQDDADVRTMRSAIDQWKQKLGSGVVLVSGVSNGKVTLIAGVTGDLADRFHAGRLIQALAPAVDGRGGGKPDLAQGGGSKAEAVDQLAGLMHDWVKQQDA